MVTAADELAEFCTETLTYESLPDPVVTRAKEFLLDSIGIAIAAAEYDSSESVLLAMDSLGAGEGPATVWGTGERTTAEHAAFLNGTFVHTPEIDDTHSEGVIHPAASVIPAAMAVAERDGIDGRSVIEGIVAGYEVAVRLAVALPSREHADEGFHPTATCGVFGATAAVAAALDLSSDELADAFGVNVSQAAGSRQWSDNGAWTKRIHPGMAAKNAILAVALAESGFRGSSGAIAGEWGFLNIYGGDAPRAERVLDGLGDAYAISETGIKPYACCRYFHTPIDVTLAAVTENDVEPEEITDVRLYGSRPVYELRRPVDRKTRPESLVDAQFSPYYAVAVAAVDRAASVDQYDPDRFDDPEIRSLIDATTVVEDESMTARHPREWPARIEIDTKRGSFGAEASLPRGDPDHRLSIDELTEKFRTLAQPLEPSARPALIDAVFEIDDVGVERIGSILQEHPRPVR